MNLEVDQPAADTLLVRLSGDWVLHGGLAKSEDVLARASQPDALKRIAFDTAGLAQWDTSIVVFLTGLQKACQERKIEFDLASLPKGVQGLINLATAVPERAGARRKEEARDFLVTIGKEVVNAVKASADMLEFLGESILVMRRAIAGKARFRRSDFLVIVEDCGADALPIVSLISFLIGVILAFVGLIQLQQFGAEIFVANLVGIGMVREVGGLMAAIVMAGRTGAAFAAQLGTMNVNQEINALETLGIPPMDFLVLPRMLALILMMPLLVVYANIVGMFGGWLVTLGMTEISMVEFFNQLTGAVSLVDWAGGLFKAAVFGVIVAIAGCLRGMQCSRSAAAVGNAATSAVVTAIVFIIASNATLTVLYSILGI